MIFISKNESGIPAYKLVLSGEKTVTRRMNPVEVGKSRAVQPGRGKFAVGRIMIISCESNGDWYNRVMANKDRPSILKELESEATREGFGSWAGLWSWLREHKTDINKTFRIEFELEKEMIP